MIDLSDLPPPAPEALIVYVELREEDVHFFDSALKAFDHTVNPRRDVKLINGKLYYKNYVAPDFWPDVQSILETLRQYIFVGDIVLEP
ncbi:hypothetical protein HRbin07_00154 [bacterium HR07]|uniref:Uncharacterized protein n=2 Tax=Candidatus Bipolaricaulota TaxID=67810 RepID=H5SMM2_9BACT|nr:hypothetical protein HGMM_F50D11C17 [uncultured Acetothermia bacterium]BAL59790.1 hypothetical protein HGMM_OP4C426 [Candidatus Acetothermum autotrophicum]GBC75962.1 hypothetical protein HRbin07_00154 [bacterium HR07]